MEGLLLAAGLQLPNHEVRTAVAMGWGQLENGDLLGEAEAAGFESGVGTHCRLHETSRVFLVGADGGRVHFRSGELDLQLGTFAFTPQPVR